MSLLLRRIVQNRSVSKATPIARAFVTYPLGRDPCSLPEINTNVSTSIDPRPIPLRYRVRAMIEMSNLDKAAEISHLAVLDEFRDDIKDTVFICNSVIGAMCDAKRYDEAMSLFNYFFNEYQALPNTLSCNLIIKAHCDLGRVDDALQLYRHIVAPGIETYRILTKALVDAKRFDEACDLVVARSSCDFMVYDILIRGFLDIGEFVKASQILQELKGGPDSSSSKLPWREYHKAIAIFNVSFIKYWFKQGKDEVAMEIYAGLEKAQVMKPIVGNRVLQVLVEHGKKTEAWELFEEMIDTCDSETVGIIMSKNFSEKTIPIERLRKTCYKTVIASLCEQGKVSEAEKLFAEMFSDDYDHHLLVVGPDVPTFRAMINGYVKVGRVDDALKMLDKMNISYLRKLAIHRAT